MQSISLTTLAGEHLAAARRATSGRSARTIHGGRENALRQTLLVLAAGRRLDGHDNPGEAQVLRGHVRLATSRGTWEGTAGDYLVIPPERHDLTAIEHSVVLLTVVARLRP